MKHQSHKAAAAQEYGGLARDRGVWLQCAIAAVVYLLFACSIALGQQRPSEYQVEAAYLYNFGRFVEWPAKDTTPGSPPLPYASSARIHLGKLWIRRSQGKR